MQSLAKWFNLYINSSVHVALAVVSLAVISLKRFELAIDWHILLYIFLASITGYNFVKYAGIAKLHHASLAKNLRIIQVFSFLAFLGLIFFTFHQPYAVLTVSALLGLFTMLYALPVFSGNTNLRGLTGVKIFVIAFVWAGATVLLPLVAYIDLWQKDVLLLFVQNFCLIFAITLPFEIRDLRFDMAQLGTIPQQFGVKGTRIIGIIVIGGFVLLEFLKNNSGFPELISINIMAGLVILLLKYASITQSKYYSSFWVEAIPIFYLLLLVILTSIL
ncbi:hypothetical protein L1I30_11205 [Gillisia sp. M10.2A]|uniref:Prenyltransferase n=1 Tax=Gillisia lutea TaxID=2909668 RepID=A0ABS9EHA8_9FLAO|nr:hypothetical protein [Gillisia lutea]MCF4102236.1 hypothetical protein [Gillisia lutea]